MGNARTFGDYREAVAAARAASKATHVTYVVAEDMTEPRKSPFKYEVMTYAAAVNGLDLMDWVIHVC